MVIGLLNWPAVNFNMQDTTRRGSTAPGSRLKKDETKNLVFVYAVRNAVKVRHQMRNHNQKIYSQRPFNKRL